MIENHSEDRISQLPDVILLIIMSLLPFTDLVILCASSKRFRPLLPYIHSLNFEVPKIRSEVKENSRLLPGKRLWYINWVNQVLNSHRASTIDQFTIDFDLRDTYSSREIDSWLDFAFKRRVQRLDLMLVNGLGYALSEALYNHLKTPVGLLSIKGLTSLCLRYVKVSGEVLEHFLSNCPKLERLIVEGIRDLDSLKVVASSPLQLKHLEILRCLRFKFIDICAPSLETFLYLGRPARICFRHVPSLVHLYLGGIKNPLFAFSPLPSCVSQLQTLYLDFFLDNMTFPDMAELTNLKQLTVSVYTSPRCSLLGVHNILKAAPLLEKLKIMLEIRLFSVRKQKRVRRVIRHQYPRLKVVEIAGFAGYTIDCEIILHLIENAIMLEKLILDRRHPKSFGTPREFDFKEDKYDIRAKRRALQLKAKVPAGVELSII